MYLDKGNVRCNTCGSLMKFHPRKQQLVCEHCENSIAIKVDKKVVKHFLNQEREIVSKKLVQEEKKVICQSCGATIEGENQDITIECPYCGSYHIFPFEQEIVPDGILPFFIDQVELKELFRKWIKKRFFAPNKLKNLYQQHKFQGTYLPYWIFDVDAIASYTGLGGIVRQEHYKDEKGNMQTRTWTDWYPVSGQVKHQFLDLTISASIEDKSNYATEVLPFAVSSAKPYMEEYLCGFGAKKYQVPMGICYENAVRMMESDLHNDARNDILRQFDETSNIKIQPEFMNEQYRYILLPVYKTSYFFQKKEYIVFINGQTGHIYGEYPKSIWKILFIVFVTFVILYILYLLSQ